MRDLSLKNSNSLGAA